MNMVAEEAGVTRGAIMHHFPSRADMMAHVVEAVTEESMEMYGDLLAGIDDPRERMFAYPRVACEIDSRPAGIAVLEILLGSRSDKEVADKLTPVRARLDEVGATLLRQDLRRDPSSSLVFLIIAVSRGLSITETLAPGTDQAAGVIDLLQRLQEGGSHRPAPAAAAGGGGRRRSAQRGER
jgi:AcrR family transcriptional regulator